MGSSPSSPTWSIGHQSRYQHCDCDDPKSHLRPPGDGSFQERDERLELSDLKNGVLHIFETDINGLGNALLQCCLSEDSAKMDAFVHLVDGDLTCDHLQHIYQYYLADRQQAKQDFTPICLAKLLSSLIGDADVVVDLCAGSGALTIQRWVQNPEQIFHLYELDETVIPYLLFNLAVRNITAMVYRSDVLHCETYDVWAVQRGDRYGHITCVQSSV